MSKSLALALALALTIVACAMVFAQPKTAPDWPFGSAAGDAQRRVEYDRDGDHVKVNLRGVSSTPTPAALNRCVVACDAVADKLVASVNGGAFSPLTGTDSCSCPGTGTNATSVGVVSSAAGTSDVCLGAASTCDGPNATCLGQGATCLGQDSICLGRTSLCDAANSFCAGSGCSCSVAGACIGKGCVCAANEFTLGATAQPYTVVRGGAGSTAPTPVTTTYTASDATGTNANGSPVQIRGGISTGAGATGDVILVACPGGPPGSTLNTGTCYSAWTVSGENGNLNPATLTDIGNVQPVRKIYAGELALTGVSGTGQVVCVKSNGELGVCSDAPDGSGVCTCG